MQKEIKIIAQKLKTINKSLYIVGGFCRDMIMGIESDGDIDLVTDALPGEFEQVLNVVGDIGKKYGTCIVREGGKSFELTTFRQDIGTINFRKPAEIVFTLSLELDAKRRDFTCNSIYFDVEKEIFIDPNNGIQDIKNKKLRFVGKIEDRIHEDILRLLRAIRFKNKYDLEFAQEKYKNIFTSNIELLKNISIERIIQELNKMVLNKNNTKAIYDLKEIGFLDIFLPEITALEKVPGNKHHLEGNVFIHTMMCFEEMNTILEKSNLTDEEKLILLWGILLHDIGKTDTLSFSLKDNDNHYFGHEDVGAELFKNQVCERLLFPNKTKDIIYYMIKNHIRIFQIPDMKKLKSRKFMMEKYFSYLLLLSEADSLGKIPRNQEKVENVKNIYNDFQLILSQKKFYTGNEIIKMYPDLVGSQIGEKLNILNDSILIKDL